MCSIKFFQLVTRNVVATTPPIPLIISMTSNKQFKFKLVLVGEKATGKSSLVLRYVNGYFSKNLVTTLGAAFMTQTLAFDDAIVKFEIWDTGGEERFRCLAPMYYRTAQAAVVVYDVTSYNSFEQAQYWISELRDKANKDIIIALAGNKVDLCNDVTETEMMEEENNIESRQVTREMAQIFAKENNLIHYETSAKTGECVHELFLQIAEDLLKKFKEVSGACAESQRRGTISLNQNQQNENKDKCCNLF